jgi:hypothetical protein
MAVILHRGPAPVFALHFAVYFVYSYVANMGWFKSVVGSSKKGRSGSRKGLAGGGSGGAGGAAGAVPVMTAEQQQDWVKGTPYDSFVKQRSSVKGKKTPAK